MPLRASTRFCLISLAWSKLQRLIWVIQVTAITHTWPVLVSWFPKLPVFHARPSPLVSLRCWCSPRYQNHLMSFRLPLGLRMLKGEYNCSLSEIVTWPCQECRGWLKHDSDMLLAFPMSFEVPREDNSTYTWPTATKMPPRRCRTTCCGWELLVVNN